MSLASCGRADPGPRGERRRAIVFVLGLYLVLAISCSLLVPLWEAPDEPAHFLRLRSEARRLGLTGVPDTSYWLFRPGEDIPPADHPGLDLQRREGFWKKGTVVSGYERQQPPGYYLAAALLYPPAGPRAEPPFFFDHEYDRHWRRLFFHRLDWTPPFREATLALHLLRLLSVACGAAAAWCTWRLAGRLLPGVGGGPLAVAGAAAVAFLPQFVFVNSSLNNDAPAIFLAALFFLLLLRRKRTPGARPRGLAGVANALLAAFPPLIVLLAGLLTKPTLVFLVPAAAAYLLAARALRQGRPRRAFFAAAACAILFFVLVAAPGWLVLPLPEGTGGGSTARQLQRLEQVGQGLMEGEALRETARLLFLSSWGVFGWMTLFPPPALIAGYLAMSILVVIGLWRLFRRNGTASGEAGGAAGREGAARGWTGDAAGEPSVGTSADHPARPLREAGSLIPAPGVGALFGVACLCLTALVFRNSLFTFQPQGRFLLPLLPLAAPLAAAGLARLGPRRIPGRFLLPVILFLLGASAYGLLGMVLPCYHPTDGQALMKFRPSGDSAIIVGQYAEGFSVEEHRRQATRARLIETGALRLVSTSAGPRDVSLRLAVEGARGPWLLEVWDREKRLAGFPSGGTEREPGGPAGEKTGSGETPFGRAAFGVFPADRAPAAERKQSPAALPQGGSRHRILLERVRLEPGENVLFFHVQEGRPEGGLLFTSISLVSASPEGQAAAGDGNHERG